MLNTILSLELLLHFQFHLVIFPSFALESSSRVIRSSSFGEFFSP